MKEKNKNGIGDGMLAIALIFILLVIDQTIKVLVKTNMELGQSIHITDWFQILFIENNGMAYGMTFFNKLVLSLFRIVAIGAIGFYLWRVVHTKHKRGYVVALAMVLAGAAGNILTRCFMDWCSTSLHISQCRRWYHLAQDMRRFCMGGWLICSIFRLS